MLSEQQIKQLLNENETLLAELKEANEILDIKEEELAMLKEEATNFAELQSLYQNRLNDLGVMQNYLGEKQQQAEGAAEREKELQEELTDAYGLKPEYDSLLQEYAALRSELNEAKLRLNELNDRNKILEQTAKKAAELQSELDVTIIEKETLQLRIQQLEGGADNRNLEEA